ncbi:hypothetical protein CR513_48534, partial [Mucuna pruriens]
MACIDTQKVTLVAFMILHKDNKARVMHYKGVDPMKDRKFSDQIARRHINKFIILFRCLPMNESRFIID